MDILTLRDRLRDRILGKEELLKVLEDEYLAETRAFDRLEKYSAIRYLELSIETLSEVLRDVEECCQRVVDETDGI